MGHNATIEYAVAKIHRRGPQDRCKHQPGIVGHAGLDNHLHAASSTAGEHLATNMLEPEASPDRHDCQLTYCEAWNHWGCRDSLGHNATDELHVSKIHRRGPQDKYEYQPEQDGHTGLETHVHAASSLAGGTFGDSGLSMIPARTPPHRASYK